MKPTRLLSLLLACPLLAALAPAQTATWTAVSGPGSLTADWNDPANWDTGSVPNSAAATAVLRPPAPYFLSRNTADWLPPFGYSYFAGSGGPGPGSALPVITGDIRLGALQFDLPPAFLATALYVGAPDLSATGRLLIDGPGILISSGDTTEADVNVLPGSSLTFAQQAVIRSADFSRLSLRLFGSPGTPATLRLDDDARFDTAPFSRARGNVTGLGPVTIVFDARARAGNANFNLPVGASVAFYNQASAESATFQLRTDSQLLFAGSATAGTADIYLLNAGPVPNTSIVRFAGNATAASSRIRSDALHGGAVEFTEQATGGGASIGALRRLDISGAETGTGSTGRLRAVNSIPAPTSVVATDARTISLARVTVQDLLLGSNTLEVGSGYIGNIRDSGAYLSAAGENLVGGGLVKTGPGTLILTYPTFNPADALHPSYFTFTGPTLIRQGEVVLYNRLGSTTVESAGSLRGNGIVSGNLLNQGRIAPEYLTTVTGNYTQTAGATYVFNSGNLLFPDSPVPLQIGGSATLAGRLETSVHAGLFPGAAPATRTTVALTAGSITGRFDAVGGANIPVRGRISAEYSATSVSLRLEWLPIASLATTPGQKALGAYLDASYVYTGYPFPPNYNAIVGGLNSATDVAHFSAILDNFSPDRYGAILEQGFATAAARAGTLDRQLAATRAAPRDGLAVFAEGTSRRATYAPIDGLPEASARASGGLAGARWRKGALTFGLYAARETTSAALDAAGSHARVQSTEPGVFAQFARPGFFAAATASFSRDDYRLDRLVDYQFFDYSALNSAAPSGRRTDLGLTLGRSLQRKQWSATVFAGVLASSWQCDDFTETSQSYLRAEQLAIAGWSRRSLRSRAGVEFTRSTADGRLRAHLKAVWLHEFETDRTIPARFVAAPAGYLAPGRPAEENLYQASLGLDWRLTRQLVFSAAASTARSDHARTPADLTAGLRWEF